ncbi:MAG: hypothetical protein FJ344_00480 [Sphingomonadales bacterium]|nr:hypothetical protein [Sphingomonadales bacterium]
MQNESSSNRNKLGLVLILLLLFGSLGVLYSIWNKNRELKEESQRLLLEKEVQIQQAIGEINTFKGQNAQLDSLVKVAEESLIAKSASLDSMLAVNRITESQLKKFKEENKQLNYYKKLYLKQIDSLIQANQLLIEENNGLKQDISMERITSERLRDDNASLSNKVALGSMLRLKSVSLGGVRMSGTKEKSISKASKVEKLKICIILMENALAKKGNRVVYLRIFDPKGALMQIDGTGSGSTTLQGKEFQYTALAPVDYNQEDTPLCIYWNKGGRFVSGSYKAEVYCDGSLIGNTTLSLK